MSNDLEKLTDEELIQYYSLLQESNKRAIDVKINHYDTKYAYHLVRLLNQCEQLLTEGDMDLQRSREQLKAIRGGEVTEKEIREYFKIKERDLEKLYHESTVIPYKPDEAKIKKLLLECLEHHYGNLDNAIIQEDRALQALREVQEVIDRHQRILTSSKSKRSWWKKLLFGRE